MQIDRKNPAESFLQIPAVDKGRVDWATCNRIADANPDFAAYIKGVIRFFRNGDFEDKTWETPTPQ